MLFKYVSSTKILLHLRVAPCVSLFLFVLLCVRITSIIYRYFKDRELRWKIALSGSLRFKFLCYIIVYLTNKVCPIL